MNMELVKKVTETQIKKDLPALRSGDTVKVHVRIVEGNKERIQNYQGVIIAIKGSGVARAITVRKISGNVGVERVFNVNSPLIAKIEVLNHGKVRRTKLYYLRKRTGKAAKVSQA